MTPVERPSSAASPSQSSSELFLNDDWNIVGEDLTDYSCNTTASTWQEEAHWMSFRHAVQKFALLSVNKSTNIIDEGNELSDGDSTSGGDSWIGKAASLSSSTSDESALAADLAETRMRLALADAERDELEFVLLQYQHKGSSVSTVSSH